LLPFIIAGLTLGSVYGLAGVGLVLTYKTTGIFNFAYGALATVAAFLFYTLHIQWGMSWPAAAAICVFVAGPVLGLILERITRSLSQASLTVRVVSTVGILLVIQSAVIAIYGQAQTLTVPVFLPARSFAIGTALVSVGDIIIIAIGLLSTVGLYCFFRFARLGVAMRAVVNDPDLLDIAGTSPASVRRYAWVIGVCFASVSGVLLAPLLSLDATTLTLLVVTAFGAAAIGRFTSLPFTYVGGLVIGVAESVATKYFTAGVLSNLPSAVPFIVLFVILLVMRRRRSDEDLEAGLRPANRTTWRTPWPVQLGGAALLIAVLALVPSFAGFHLTDWTLFLAAVIVFLSLGLLVRTSGQVSLAQVAFMAIGVSAFSHLTVGQHLPWGLALLLAGLIAVPIGALLSIPAIRLSGIYLALATLGFGIVVSYMFYSAPYMFGSTGLGLTAPMPSLPGFNTTKGYYYLVLLLTVIIAIAVVALNRSRLGRLLRALADSPRGLATSGTAINITRVLVFCIAAFLAAIGGALGGVAQSNVSGVSYPPLLSLTYFAVVIITVGGEPWYAILAAAGLALVPSYFPSTNTTTYLTLLFGIFAVLYTLTPEEFRGVPQSLRRRLDQVARRSRKSPGAIPGTPPVRPQQEPDALPVQLNVEDIRVRFGGVVAVDSVDMRVSGGQVIGLIGPNGAGKTTTFNAISGLLRPDSGKVRLDGHDLSRLGASSRARHGLGRTFQRMELFDSLTVADNVRLGMEASFAGRNPLDHFLSLRGRRTHVLARADDAMAVCGITHLADTVVGSLSTGQRRLVELARCLAGPFRLLLLDEPSSGLDGAETVRFGEVLSQVARDRSLAILLVEHDMSLVTAICQYIYVLDFGKKIFEGPPPEVLAAPIVRAAYLGDDDVEDLLLEEVSPEQVS
jgi:ABC-type branched-subunit amino acid transport system ATPase component/branched-subunit amino acid ABC-type transport system permease component